MKIRIHDTVKILGGKDRGKTGKVIQVFPESQKVVVEGANKMVKHIKARKSGEKGQRIEFSAPLPASRVALVCGSCSQATRVGYKISGEVKARICKKCGQEVAVGQASK